jgi:TolA-binding protein
MSADTTKRLTGGLAGLVAVSTVFFALWMPACGTVEETTDEWESVEPVSATAKLEYRIDSLVNENRRMRQQVEAMAAENRNLTARTAELETKLNEAIAAAQPAQTAPPPTPSPVRMTSPDMSSGYSEALALYRDRNFQGAAGQFEALLNSGTAESLQDNCHYWLGESNYGMGKFSEAVRHFEMVLSYKRSEKKDDAQLMIGNSYLAMGNKAAAREAFNKLVTSFPSSPFVQKAQEKLARLQ